jgi:glycylpeptide N-tetradecanoyltransferase
MPSGFAPSQSQPVAPGSEASREHKFWKTQPVPQAPTAYPPLGPLEVKELSQVKPDPLKLPEGFSWVLLDWQDANVLEEAYVLLRDNYVEDDDAMFRFDYSKEFLRWALMVPGWKGEWQVGVRNTKSGKLLAMITATPAHVSAAGNVVPMVEINFLCVHKSLRDKRLAPVLIKEVTRRVNLCNIWQAVYTAGVEIPTPIGVAKYWHRSLNPRKLIDVGFTALHGRQTIQRLNRLMQMPEQVSTPGWRPTEEKDIPQVGALLRKYLAKFKVHIHFLDHELAHVFLPRHEVVSSYVVADSKGKITDFASFYHLYSSVIRNPKHKTLKAAYSYYNAPGSLSLHDLMHNLLIEAAKQDLDVFNALDLMENKPMLEPLKFGIGDGNLHYYLYNYSMGAHCEPEDIGIVLL